MLLLLCWCSMEMNGREREQHHLLPTGGAAAPSALTLTAFSCFKCYLFHMFIDVFLVNV